MRFLFFSLFYLTFISNNFSQVSITTTNYSQNFGTTTKSSWTDNSTYSGWYLSAGGTFYYGGTQNITTSAPTNTGGFYTYQCSSDGNIKLGSRPSNTSGGSSGSGLSHIGLRLRNNTGQTIESITVSYKGYQLSLAENGTSNTNSLTFSYQISTTAITSLTSGTWNNITSLNYNAPNNSSTQGSNQVSGYPCTVTSTLSSCINTSSLGNGSEIMLRWSDVNNTFNDHHLAIDDIQVLFHFDNICAVTLPVELLSFQNSCKDEGVEFKWSTSSERENAYFTLEETSNGIDFYEISKIQGAGTSTIKNDYKVIVPNSFENENSYFRLKQTDYDGKISILSDYITLNCNKKEELNIYPNPTSGLLNIIGVQRGTTVKIYNEISQLILEINELENEKSIDLTNFPTGLYFVQMIQGPKIETKKISLITEK